MTPQLHQSTLIVGIALALQGCARGSSSTFGEPNPSLDTADAATDSGSLPDFLPGPVSGWEKPFDGITCRHPDVQAHCSNGWCRVPAGCFIKGSPPDELGRGLKTEEQRAVTLTHDVWIQQTEVTQEQWLAQGLPNPSGIGPDGTDGDCTDDPRCPVGNVTWFETLAFANMQSKAHLPPLPSCYELHGCTGSVGEGMRCESVSITAPSIYECEGFRLLTDAEYEYALRAGTTTAFYTGSMTMDALADASQCNGHEPLLPIAWYCANAGRFTHPVGQKRPNSWHLYDMAGNSEEWVHDEEKGKTGAPGPWADPGGTMSTYKYRQTRGGSVISWPRVLRSASRALGGTWGFHSPTIGFRLARSVLTTEAAAKGW